MLAPRAWLLLLAAPLACDGRGARALNDFAEGMQTLARILLVLAVIGGLLYLGVWALFLAGLRRGRPSRLAALVLVAVHVFALLETGDISDAEAHRWLWWTAPLPAAALALALAARLPARLGLGLAATAGLWLLPADPPPLRSLPGPLVALASDFTRACVVTDRGHLVCEGSVGAGCDEDDSPRTHFDPRHVPALAGADQVHMANNITCVRRPGAPVRCCGGRSLRPPGAPTLPWDLPIAGPDAQLVVTDAQLLARTGDLLQAWPHPLPAGLRSARAIAGNDGTETHLAVVDRDGELWMWRQDGPTIARLARVPGLADAEEVAVQRRTGACVRRTSGAVACFPWPDSGDPGFAVPDLRAAQLLAIDDAFDSFCARTTAGAVLCWEEGDRPRPFAALPRATRLVATNAALCDLADGARCVNVGFEVDRPLVDLLALQSPH